MKWIVLLLTLASSLLAQNVTNAAFDGISHSALRMTIYYEGSFDAIRARYVPTPASCKDGKTGPIQVISFYKRFNPMPVLVSGLKAETSYEICPELSSDGGVTWSKGYGAPVTTLPLPTPHPALPIAPEKFDSSYPSTSEYRKVAAKSDCSDLHDLLMVAIDRSLDSGTVINLPAGRACTIDPFAFNTNPPDMLWFGKDSISIGSNTLKIPQHRLAEGQKIQIANYTPYRGGSLPFTTPMALADGQAYYAHVVGTDAIQVYYGAPPNNGGTLLQFVSQGTGGDNYVVPLPRRVKPIVIQSAGADVTFPEHVRVGPGSTSGMTKLIMPKSQIGAHPQHYLFRFSDYDSNVRRPIGNLRFVGIEFTTEDFADLHNTIDPDDFEQMFIMSPWNSEITIDRCLVHSPGTPTRWNRGMFWDGAYLSVVDSYFENLTYFHATNDNVAASIIDGTHAQISAGTSYSGGSVHTLASPVVITISGNASGEILTGWDLQTNRYTVWTPPGLAASCGGITCVNLSYTAPNNGSCAWSDAWPRNGSGWPSAHPTGCFNAINGTLNTVTQGDPTTSHFATEGCNYMIGGNGPGPYKVVNTKIEGAGLAWHHDDGGLNKYLRGDYDYERNTFHGDSRFRYGSRQSDHLKYFHRQMLEWKGGSRLYLSGNIFDGGWVEDNPASVLLALTAVNGQTISDVNLENNEFRHGPGGLNLVTPTKSHNEVVLPPQRLRLYNNLFWDINSGAETTCDGQPSYTIPGSSWNCSTGWFMQGPWSAEDIIIDRNTFADNMGRVPSFMRLGDGPVEGLSVTRNIASFADQGFTLEPLAVGDPCQGLTGKSLADCKLPGYAVTANVLVGQSGSFSGTDNMVGGTLGILSYLRADFSTTPLAQGAGADISALRAAQGPAQATTDVECSSCVPARPTVSVRFQATDDGASIIVSGDGCSSGPYSLPTTLAMVVGSNCATQVTPPSGFEFIGWANASVTSPPVFIVPSSDSTVTLSFRRLSSSNSSPIDLRARTVPITLKGSVNGARVRVEGSGCNPGEYALPISLAMTVADTCNFQVTPPNMYEFVGWSDGPAVNPRSIVVPSNSSTLVLSFNSIATPPSNSPPNLSPSGVRLVPIAPCRVMDTRETWPIGGEPSFNIGETRTILMDATRCHLPAASAYSVNITVVPLEPLRWITVWPTGVTMPYTSVLNSYDGRIKSAATIVAAGEHGGVSIFATNRTHVILDVTGYFSEDSQSTYHPLIPCRVVDTREFNGRLLGSPPIPALIERSFPILSSPCGLPESAEAYAINLTVIPRKDHLTWMTAWPSGQERPLASAVNVPTATPVANSAIIARGAGGSISVYGSDDFDLIIDVGGYFAVSPGGYAFYPALACRILDTRESEDPLQNGIIRIDAAGACNLPADAKAIAGVITAVPHGPLRWLTSWGEGDQPLASTLNAYDGMVASNFAITPLTGSVSFNIFASDPTETIVDMMGYFAP